MPKTSPCRVDLAVSYAARSIPSIASVALDEFDMENVSALREHLRIPGMGLTHRPLFSRQAGHARPRREAGILVPEFVHVLNSTISANSCLAFPTPGCSSPARKPPALA